MRLSGKLLSETTTEDLLRLVQEEVSESRTLDYKLELTDDNKELLADITALANTDGGVIVYGVEEKKENGKNTGIPCKVVGIEGIVKDHVKQRIENALRDNVEPRLQNIEVEAVDFGEDKVLLVGVPRSLFAPHMLRKDSKFYARNSAGKFAMDVHQIRDAFLQSADWEKQADNFRRTRTADFLAEKSTYLQEPRPAVLLHIVPLGINRPTLTFREDPIEIIRRFPLYGYGNSVHTYNFEGVLLWPGRPGASYIQFFRNGSIEFGTSNLYDIWNDSGKHFLEGTDLEFFVVRAIRDYMQYATEHDVTPPFGVYLSIISPGGKLLGQHAAAMQSGRLMKVIAELEAGEILFPGIVINSTSEDIAEVMRPIFDILWQTANKEGSPHYSREGKWRLKLEQ